FPATFEECFQSRYGSVLDMCYLNLTPLFSRFETEKAHGKIYICPLDLSSYNPNASFRSVYGDSSEDIVGSSSDSIGFNLSSPVTMVGYPTGLWDDVNNYPLLRKGSVATHPHIDFKGKKEFLIDIPLYPGSSGSPVLYSREREGKTYMYFVGMVWGRPTHPIQKMPYPTDKTDSKAILDTQSNLIAGL